jgi:hypothetical protein
LGCRALSFVFFSLADNKVNLEEVCSGKKVVIFGCRAPSPLVAARPIFQVGKLFIIIGSAIVTLTFKGAPV